MSARLYNLNGGIKSLFEGLEITDSNIVNADDVEVTGAHSVSLSDPETSNYPVSTGLLVVFKKSNNIMQVFIDSETGCLYSRAKDNSNVWSNWGSSNAESIDIESIANALKESPYNFLDRDDVFTLGDVLSDNYALSATWEIGKYASVTSGAIGSNGAFSYTELSVTPGQQIHISGIAPGTAVGMSSRAVYLLDGVKVLGLTEDLWQGYTYNGIVPQGVNTIRINAFFNNISDIKNNVVIKFGEQQYYISVDDNHVNHVFISDKRWVSFGDSITARNSWQPYIAEKFGLNHTNLGIGSTFISNYGSTPMCSDARIDGVIAANPDIVTIFGGANDIVSLNNGGTTIGTIEQLNLATDSKDKLTFYGAYGYIIEKLLAWKPTLRIIIMGMYYAHADGTSYGNIATYTDISNATRNIAAYYSLPFVDLHGECGFNKYTMGASPYNVYSSDNIHPNEAGAKRIEEAVCRVFSTIVRA